MNQSPIPRHAPIRRPLPILVVLGVLTAALPGAVVAQVRATPPDSLDRFIERRMEERQIPGLALAVAENGRIVVARTYGVADVQNGGAVRPETRFDLASITKPFTAAGIMLLVEEGRIDLDASIAAYLPEAPESWSGITVRHLLNHTSGLPYPGPLQSPPIDITNEMWLAAAFDDPLEFDPGTRFQYSDRNYKLLGIITERVSGIPWRDFMPARVFMPLRMHDTYIVDRRRIFLKEARNYDLSDGELVNARRVYHVETPSHNGVFSNVLDLVKWDAALYTADFLSEESRRLMWEPTRLTGGVRHPYGLGWALDERAGRPVQLHGGVTGTMMLRFPQDTLAVIVLSNLGAGNDAEGIAWHIAEMMIPGLRRGLQMDPPEAHKYVGDYVNERALTVKVLMRNEILYLIPPQADQPVELVYQGGARFTMGERNTAVEFLMDEDGHPTGLVVYPAGYVVGSIRFHRR